MIHLTFTLKREIPVETGYDVLVAGGGPAGYSAAISAARLGAKVLLVESSGSLGGMGTNGLVSCFDTTSDGTRMIVGGIMSEIIDKMFQRGFISPYYPRKRFEQERGRYTPFDPEGLKILLDELVAESGVEVRFFTRVIDAETSAAEGGVRVDGAVLSNVEGYSYIRANTFIDATGDATLASLSGAECLRAGQGNEKDIMPPTLCALFSGIDWDSIEMKDYNPAAHSQALRQAIKDGFFSQPEFMVPGIHRNCGDSGEMNAGHVFGMDALNIGSLSQGMVTGRRLIQEYEAYYRKYIAGFENVRLMATGSLMGVRESRRIVGEYTLCFEDYIARRKFSDQIGVYSKGVDIHPYTNMSEEEFQDFRKKNLRPEIFQDGESYGVPYGVIVPKGYVNLYAAGRCASSDRLVNSSMRVQPICSVLGQAAGTAAYLCALEGMKANSMDVARLQILLAKQGAVLD